MGRSTGEIRAVAQSARDKGRAFEWLQRRAGVRPGENFSERLINGASCSSSGDKGGVSLAARDTASAKDEDSVSVSGGTTVYIGDSVSDLPPLLSADIGIVVSVWAEYLFKCEHYKFLH